MIIFCTFVEICGMKRLSLLFAMIVLGMGVLRAQSTELALGVRCGHNALFGRFAALSAEAQYEAKSHFVLRGGAQYSTIGRVAAELRPQYFHDFSVGRLTGQMLLGSTHQNLMNNYFVGGGASLDLRCLWVTLGYYHRTIVMGEDRICEPFNIYYELGIRTLHKLQKWDLNIMLTNSRPFELERHYQPSFVVEAWWHPGDRLSVLLGANYKPAGMFNITSDYYQIYGNIGVCYRW